MENKFRYDAFISYRHADLDKFVAENLHKQLESFRLPKSVAKKRKGQKNKIERVFRDKDELPLTSNLEDPIVQALQSSEWLIVICSPRLRESLWCKKEIETFVALRGRERVLAVLIEGEPAESFPEELLYKIEKRTLPDGTVEEVRIPAEPLAADVRGKNKKQILKAMKTEVLRLLAPIFDVNYDDLRQRHRERKMRRIVTASLIGAAACLLFGVYSTATALRIQKQNQQIEAQSAEIKQQSDEIKQQSDEILKQNEELALRQARALAELAAQALEEGDREGAIKIAVEALTESEGIALPYTAEAQYVLTDSLRVYDNGNVYKAEYQYESAGALDFMEISPDRDTLVLNDTTGSLTLFDLENREVIDTISSSEYDKWGISGCVFLGMDKFAYVNTDEEICIYNLEERQVIQKIKSDYVSQIYTDYQGKYIVTSSWGNNFAVYNGETFQKIGETVEIEGYGCTSGPFVFSDGVMACTYSVAGTLLNPDNTLYFMDLNTLEIISTYHMGHQDPEDIEYRDGVAYISSNDYGSAYLSSDAYVCAIDVADGSQLWEYVQKGYWASYIDLPVNEGAEYLNFVTNGSAIMISMQTGEVSFAAALPSDACGSEVYVNTNQYLIFCEDGEMIVVDAEASQIYDLSYKFECKSTSNFMIKNSPYGIVVLGTSANRVTVYTMRTGADVVETEMNFEYPEIGQIYDEKAVELAQSYGLDNPDLVLSAYYNDDEKYCFLQYWDRSLVIYDTEAGKVVNTLDWTYPTEWCLGTDAEGYTYLLGYGGCYIMNENMEPVAWIPDAVEVDMENKKVYLSWNYNYYEAPLYSLDELLQMAETYHSQE